MNSQTVSLPTQSFISTVLTLLRCMTDRRTLLDTLLTLPREKPHLLTWYSIPLRMGHRDRDKMGSRDMETADNTGKADNMDSRIHREDHRLYSRYSVLLARIAIHSRHMESTLYAAMYICNDTHYDTRKGYHYM